ncbi:MAG: hypothetical protein GX811_11055 [Lentisphaerae bacterium]|nr:hypothetical protein [Lentisphaerota bacterium]
MKSIVETACVLLVLSGFGLLGFSRLVACIKITAAQGICLGALVIAANFGMTPVRATAIGLAVIVLKGFVFPRLLLRALRESRTSREIQPIVGYVASLLFGIALLAFSFQIDLGAGFKIVESGSLMVSVAFFLFLTGLFLIVTRKTALNQVLGYLVVENGIYVFGFAIVGEIHAFIELSV